MSPTACAFRHEALIYRARHNPAAMAKLLKLYRGFFLFALKRTLPHSRRLPLTAYLGSMTIAFIRCVQLWEPNYQFTTYLLPSLRGAIRHQRREERLISLKRQRYEACQLAAASYKWEPVQEPLSDRRWNQAEHVTLPLESSTWPDWYSAELLDLWLRSLPPRVVGVIRRRLDGATYAKIGDELKVSKERVRQIERPGLLEMRRYVSAIEHKARPSTYSYWRELAAKSHTSANPQ